MANKMGELVGETEQRDAMVAKLHEEAQLQIVLLQHQVGVVDMTEHYRVLYLLTRTSNYGSEAAHSRSLLAPL